MKIKILFLILVLSLLIGCQSEVAENSEDTMEEKDLIEKEVDDENSEFYDDLDNALAELDELENS